MAEQFIMAFAFPELELWGAVGCKDDKLTKRVLRRKQKVTELDEVFRGRGPSVHNALEELVAGGLQPAHAQEYRRLIELLGPVLGKALAPEIVLPGRGWQDIGKALERWGARSLGRVWQRRSRFPWRRRPKAPSIYNLFEWPVLRIVPNEWLRDLQTELSSLDPNALRLPDRQADSEFEAIELIKSIRKWLRSAERTGFDLVIFQDGQH